MYIEELNFQKIINIVLDWLSVKYIYIFYMYRIVFYIQYFLLVNRTAKNI